MEIKEIIDRVKKCQENIENLKKIARGGDIMTNKEKLTKLRSEIAEVYDGNKQMPCKFGDTASSEVVYLHPDDVIEFLDHLIDKEGDTVSVARDVIAAGIAALHLMNRTYTGVTPVKNKPANE